MSNKINALIMHQLANIPSAIDNAHTVPQSALDCEPGLCGLN